MHRIANFIEGRSVAPMSGRYLDNVDPSTGHPYSLVPDSDAEDVQCAVESAARAFPGWSATAAEERSRILLRLADLLTERLDDFARAECIDTGKPLAVARTVDIPRAIKNLRFFGSAILHLQSESHATDLVALNYTLRRPRGVCGLISPWNLPLYLFTWKVAPALAAGNTAVAKPSEITPMTAFMLGELCEDAGLPPGVLNIVHGAGPRVGAALTGHPTVTTISFTGGTTTGATIAQTTAPQFKKLALEMGGKNPNIVFADADFDAAIAGSLRAAFANQGQICLCGSRMLVEESVYDRFVAAMVAGAKRLTVGDPLEPDTHQGAVVSRAHQDKIVGYLDLARREGGTIRCGGGIPDPPNRRCQDGFFVEPTVITDLAIDCRVNQEEIFGPVVSVVPFRSDEEAVTLANATPYGLSASVWTENLTRAHRVAEQVASGTVWINCWMLRDLRVPFGGMKQSGVGREGGWEALRFFTEPKNVCVQLGP